MYRPAMTKIHFTILRYNEIGILSGSAWLLFGCALGIILIGSGSDIFFVRDSFIHSIALGFIGSTITVFAPMLLPGLLGRKAPVTGLSLGPILLLNAGILLRIAGDSATIFSLNLPFWESLSGLLILGAIIWLVVLLPRIGKHGASPGSKPPAARNVGLGVSDVRDATLTVIGRKTGRQITIPLWFAEKDGTLYLLPMNGIKTEWYRNVLSNPRVSIEINKGTFPALAKEITEKSKVRSVIDFFKDKYGARVYRNFYGHEVDRAVMVAIKTVNE